MTKIRVRRAAQRDHRQLLLNFAEMRSTAILADPLYFPEIKDAARKTRAREGLYGRSFVDKRGRFKLAEYISYGLGDDTTLEYASAKDTRLLGAHAVTETWCRHMIFDEKLRLGLESDEPRARSIHAHELGHVLFHTARTVREVPESCRVERFEDPEEHAWAYARELLFPWELHQHLRCRKLCREIFGVTDGFYDTCCKVRRIPQCECCAAPARA